MSPDRRPIASPWLTVGLGVVLIALVAAALVVPNLIGAPRASPTAGPTAAPSGTPIVSLGPTIEPTFARPTPSPNPTFTSYVVHAGDSLISIAATYHTTARSLAWWNRGTYPSLDPESAAYAPNRIVPGWILVMIPGVTVDENNPPTPSPAPPTPTPGESPSAGPAARATVGT